MVDHTAQLSVVDGAFHVEAVERIDYSLHIVDGVFDQANAKLADVYRPG